jgi:hypothetical protein
MKVKEKLKASGQKMMRRSSKASLSASASAFASSPVASAGSGSGGSGSGHFADDGDEDSTELQMARDDEAVSRQVGGGRGRGREGLCMRVSMHASHASHDSPRTRVARRKEQYYQGERSSTGSQQDWEETGLDWQPHERVPEAERMCRARR